MNFVPKEPKVYSYEYPLVESVPSALEGGMVPSSGGAVMPGGGAVPGWARLGGCGEV